MGKMQGGADQQVVNAPVAQEGGEKVWRCKQKSERMRETTRKIFPELTIMCLNCDLAGVTIRPT
jgi:hypothetical protein